MDSGVESLEELSSLLDFEEPTQPIASSECPPPPQINKSLDDPKKSKTLQDVDIFAKEQDPSEETVKKLPSLSQVFSNNTQLRQHDKSEIHCGDTDSSDDEDNKYSAEQKYTETGRSIKNLIKKPTTMSTHFSSSSWKSNKNLFAPSETTLPSKTIPNKDVYMDPFFGIRIITPLISSQVLKERMQGKIAVSFTRLPNHIANAEKINDWVVAGVIVSKIQKTSQKGKPYVCWTLSDLKEDLKTVSLFLFGKAYQKLWKTGTHTVIAVLNPTPLDSKKTSNDIAALSVNSPDQVMIWGQSKDLGTCKARKKNGEPCKNIVNKNACDYCIYHVKQEYQKFSARSELQAPSGGSLNQLKNKVLGKNEVFYAGRSYTATVAKPAQKQAAKDQKRLSQLFNQCESRFGPQTDSACVMKPAQSARVRLMKDAERLQKLTGSPATLASLTLGDRNENMKHVTKITGKGANEHKRAPLSKKTPRTLIEPKPAIEQQSTEDSWFEDYNPSPKQPGKEKCMEKPKIGDNFKKPQFPIRNRTLRVSEIGISKPSTEKNQPTKSRFENLTKLKSIREKRYQPEQRTSTMIDNSKTPDSDFEWFDFDEKPLKTPQSEKCSDSSLNMPRKSRTMIHTTKTSDPDFHEYFDETPLKTPRSEKCSDSSLNMLRKSSTTIHTTKTSDPDFHEYFDFDEKPLKTPTKKLPINLNEKKPPLNPNSSTKNEWLGINPVQPRIKKNQNTPKAIPVESTEVRLKDLVHTNSPKLSNFGNVNFSVPSRQSVAKLKALNYVKRKGPIIKEDQNKKKRDEAKELLRKRKRTDTEEEQDENSKSDRSSLSKRFIELMNVTSKHTDLITHAENKELDDYYEKMEKKEKMEEKMLNTYKLECKAVRCLKCKYKWFSALDRCKTDNHPIKVISAVKRFFQCQNCMRRTVSLEIIPIHSCAGCGQSNWKRVPMMQERKSSNVHLSIRGGEQEHINSVMKDANLDLLVPDDGP